MEFNGINFPQLKKELKHTCCVISRMKNEWEIALNRWTYLVSSYFFFK